MASCKHSVWLLAAMLVTTAYACQVPVFRYALERWRPDPYQLVVLHDGNLTGEQRAKLSYLEESLVGENGPIENLQVETVDLAKEKEQFERWKKIHMDANGSMTVHLFYPYEGFEPNVSPIWSGACTKKNLNAILDSPTRRELVKRILSGDSAVWLFLESGNKTEDDKLFKILESYAKIAEKEIPIPEGVIQQSALEDPNLHLGPGDQENILESSVPLKIAFSIRRLSRKDPEEAILLAMLLNLEEDLLDDEFADKPMLFPVFGKGRVLPPLIGAGISEENALADCGYLCGPCSCQVKNQNPGMDLLVKADWLTALEGSSVIAEKELPPLTGVEDLIAANDSRKDSNASEQVNGDEHNESSVESTEGNPGETPFSNTLIIAVVLVSGVLLVGTFALNKNREK